MSGVWGLTQLVLMAAALCAAATLIGTSVLYPRLRSRLMGVAPSHRALVIFLFALSPVLAPVAVVSTSLAPPVVAELFSHPDHCLAHHDGHPHICPVHLPDAAGTLAGWLLIAVAVTLVLFRLAPVMAQGARNFQIVLRLRQSLGADRGEVTWIDEPRPLAFTIGWLRPRTVISSALRRRLSPAGIQALLGHEQEHRRRRDPLRRSIVEAATTLMPSSVRELLLGDWQLAVEQACDGAAAVRCGDNVEVARAILAAERGLTTSATLGVAFGGSIIEERVQQLLAPESRARNPGRIHAFVALVVVGLLAASPIIHHGLETILEALPR